MNPNLSYGMVSYEPDVIKSVILPLAEDPLICLITVLDPQGQITSAARNGQQKMPMRTVSRLAKVRNDLGRMALHSSSHKKQHCVLYSV